MTYGPEFVGPPTWTTWFHGFLPANHHTEIDWNNLQVGPLMTGPLEIGWSTGEPAGKHTKTYHLTEEGTFAMPNAWHNFIRDLGAPLPSGPDSVETARRRAEFIGQMAAVCTPDSVASDLFTERKHLEEIETAFNKQAAADIVTDAANETEAGHEVVAPRLRVLELPMTHVGPYSNTPYCLVFTNATDDIRAAITDRAEDIKAATGATGVLAFADDIELP
ncbi:hypothetical protein ACFPPE_07420 [Agromyces tardus]|uniref:hypothetical protein n=1 Tax=Agromyces tardus TaxID=2583849 RepID=UPI003622DD5B